MFAGAYNFYETWLWSCMEINYCLELL